MYKKKQHKPPPSAKSKAKTEALVNDLEALFSGATDQPNESKDTHQTTLQHDNSNN